MLFGNYKHSIDKKGRVSVPAKFRDELGESFMICLDYTGSCCLRAYSMQSWEKLVEQIALLPNVKSTKVRRYLYANAFNVELDSLGRILIPATLREQVKLESEAQIVGVDAYLEIWNTELWANENEVTTSESVAQIMEELNF